MVRPASLAWPASASLLTTESSTRHSGLDLRRDNVLFTREVLEPVELAALLPASSHTRIPRRLPHVSSTLLWCYPAISTTLNYLEAISASGILVEEHQSSSLLLHSNFQFANSTSQSNSSTPRNDLRSFNFSFNPLRSTQSRPSPLRLGSEYGCCR